MIQSNPHQLIEALLTRRQLLDTGVSGREITHLLKTQQLTKVRPGVYIPADLWKEALPSHKHIAEAQAAYLALNYTVFSHQTAALLWELPVLHIPRNVHTYCTTEGRGTAYRVTKHPRLTEFVVPQTTKFGLPATSLEQTVLDCAKSLPLAAGVGIADGALHRDCDVELLRASLLAATGWGASRARDVAKLMSAKSDSLGESLVRVLIAEHDLPMPQQQYRVFIGGKEYFLDFAYPDLKLVIEFDGLLKYTDFGPAEQSIIRERQREKALTNEGWIVVRLDWDMVTKSPNYAANLIRQGYERAMARAESGF